jgi:rhodanese-related sulfurtransferase
MLTRLFLSMLLLASLVVHGQFRNDNVTYKTVYPEDLCKTLQANPGYTILDVRSDGEFFDTLSSSPGLNIGHIKNALHIDIRQLPARWKELTAYKDQPLFIYCSHSQRSRRASRLLADSGFSKIFNINGGLTNFYAQGIQDDPCNNYKIVSFKAYKIISPKQLADSHTNYYIIDLRSDSIFNGTNADEATKMEGRFSNAINIPFLKFKDDPNIKQTDQPILLVDQYGAQSPVAAEMLVNKGYKNVSILFNGMDEWITYITDAGQQSAVPWKNFSDFSMLSPDEFNTWMKKGKKMSLIDVRSQDQFNNKSKNYWQNLGQIKNAVNIPYSELSNASGLPATSDPVVVYGFNSEDEIFTAAKWFKEHGYNDVHVLRGGIWNLRWEAHNFKNKMSLNDWVINVPAENE